MELAGLIIAILALFISGFVAWNNYCSPFRVKVYCGNPRLEPGKADVGGGKTVTRFAFILPLWFVNMGASDGIISDIAVIVNSTQNRWLFHSYFYTKYSIQTESALGKKLVDDPSNELFYPIHLQGKEKIYKSIAFISLGNENFPLGNNPLESGKYSFRVQTLEMSRKDYETKLKFDVDLTKEHISTLEAANFTIPFVEELKQKRQSLKAD